VAEQRLHSALAPIDVLTRVEMEAALHKNTQAEIRQRFLGIDSARFPLVQLAGNGGTLNLGSSSTSDGYIGPEQGDVWLVRRINVVSSVFTDPAKYILFRGSTPSDPSNYASRYLIDGMASSGGSAIGSTPGVPATGVAAQNTSGSPYTVVVNANGATITNVSVNGITVGTSIAAHPTHIPYQERQSGVPQK
jgi:hypothetical protein